MFKILSFPRGEALLPCEGDSNIENSVLSYMIYFRLLSKMEPENAARSLSWDVLADASFLCEIAAVIGDTIKWTPGLISTPVQQSVARSAYYIYACTLVLYPERTFQDVG